MDKKWWTLIVVCAATFMLLLDVTIVVVALPESKRGCTQTSPTVQWVIDAYALTLASLLLTAGSLADRYGRRLLFTIGLVIFTLGSLTCGLAQSPLMLILSRSAQGVGGAILFATSLGTIGPEFSGKERGIAFGVWGAITASPQRSVRSLAASSPARSVGEGFFLVHIPLVSSRSPSPGESRRIITRQRFTPDWAGFVFLTAAS